MCFQGEKSRGIKRLDELLAKLLSSGKERMPLKRAEYFLTVCRVCAVMEAAAKEQVRRKRLFCTKYLQDIDQPCLPHRTPQWRT